MTHPTAWGPPRRAVCFAGRPTFDALPRLLEACRAAPLEHRLVVVVRAPPREVRDFALAYGTPIVLVADDGRLEQRYVAGERSRPATVVIGSYDRIVAVVREHEPAGHVAALMALMANQRAA